MEYTIGSKVFNKWTIIDELGEGANGKVFEIEKTEFGVETKSALKVIRIPRSVSDVKEALSEGMDEKSVTTYFQGFVEKLIKEVAVMASLKSHPNIVGYEDHEVIPQAGKIGWDILIRMELLTPLPDHLIKHPMAEKDVVRLGIELAGALEYCQNKGIIHRDIKPQNIFVNDLGQFKLGDFGVARTLDQTKSGLSRSGTEGYMAPEVYLNRPYGATVDVYSLGLVLYSLMNGNRLPFLPPAPQVIGYTQKMQALERRMKGETLPQPAYASEAFTKVILRACAFDSKERYRTAGELQEALRMIEKKLQKEEEESAALAKGAEPFQDLPLNDMEEDFVEEPDEKTVSAWGEPAGRKENAGVISDESVYEDTVAVKEEATSSAWKNRSLNSELKKEEPQAETSESKQKPTGSGIGKIVGAIVVAILVLLVLGYFTVHSWEPATCDSGSICKICGKVKDNQLGHQWEEATCDNGSVCKRCGKVQDDQLGHQWEPATCDSGSICKICGKVKDDQLGHQWLDATCISPKTCDVCGKKQGNALGHQWVPATYTAPKICSVCKVTEGEPKLRIDEIAAGDFHTVILWEDGTVTAVGNNKDGQCNVSGWEDIISICAGDDHTVGLKRDGTVVAVGNNKNGQCNVSEWSDIVAINASVFHTIGVKADGTVVAVGSNHNGGCDVSDWTNIIMADGTQTGSIGLKKDGTVRGTKYEHLTWHGITKIAVYNHLAAGLKKDGTVVVGLPWSNQSNLDNGQLDSFFDITDIAVADFYVFGLKEDGRVVVANLVNEIYGEDNRLVIDDSVKNIPKEVSEWSDICMISAGSGHVVGVTDDGDIVVAGHNFFGEGDVDDLK